MVKYIFGKRFVLGFAKKSLNFPWQTVSTNNYFSIRERSTPTD